MTRKVGRITGLTAKEKGVTQLTVETTAMTAEELIPFFLTDFVEHSPKILFEIMPEKAKKLKKAKPEKARKPLKKYVCPHCGLEIEGFNSFHDHKLSCKEIRRKNR